MFSWRLNPLFITPPRKPFKCTKERQSSCVTHENNGTIAQACCHEFYYFSFKKQRIRNYLGAYQQGDLQQQYTTNKKTKAPT